MTVWNSGLLSFEILVLGKNRWFQTDEIAHFSGMRMFDIS
jgi:hypothetical protein